MGENQSRPRVQGMSGTRAPSVETVLVVGLGVACYLGTLPLLSSTVTPLQRFDALGTWIGDVATRMHVVACLVSVLAVVASVHGARRAPSDRLLSLASGCVFTAGVASFACAGVFGIPGWAPRLPVAWALCLLVGAGGVSHALAWGRLASRLSRADTLAAVGVAALGQAVIGALELVPGPVGTALLYTMLAAASTALALVACRVVPVPEPVGDDLAALTDSRQRLSSFLAVSGSSATGMAAFAFATGLMQALVTGHLAAQTGALVACGAAALVVCALGAGGKGWLLRSAGRVAVPLMCLAVLATGCAAGALGIPVTWIVGPAWALYTFAALLTLAMLAATAHAREFPSDLVFSVAFALFCLASLAGLLLAARLSDQEAYAGVAVVTAVYAAVAAGAAILGGGREALLLEGRSGAADPEGGREVARGSEGAVPSDASAVVWERGLDEACDVVATRCGLTAREREIFGLLARGHGSAYVSETLYISPNTVRTHVHNMYVKLGVSSREQLMALARTQAVCGRPAMWPGGTRRGLAADDWTAG